MASGGRKTLDSSAVVDMEVIGSDESDYEVDFSGRSAPENSGRRKDASAADEDDKEDLQGKISKGVATYVWEEGRQRARKAFSLYANIDILRPYYDVEPHEVRTRLIGSLIPRLTTSTEGRVPKVPRELYGPTMLVFTLIAMLLYQMKASGHVVQEGTLMGTAFATCFGYWFGVSSLVWVFSYVFGTRIGMTQILNTLGYALFGHCIVLFLTTLFHPAHSHLFFYSLWLAFGGLSTLKMATVLMSRTPGRSQKLAICGVIVLIHLLFLLYLHFAYHHVVEDVSEAFNGPLEHHIGHVTSAKDVLPDAGSDLAGAAVAHPDVDDALPQLPVTMKQLVRHARSNSSVLQRLSQRDKFAVAKQHGNASIFDSSATSTLSANSSLILGFGSRS